MTAPERIKSLLQQWIASTKTGQEIPLSELCRDYPELLPEVQQRVEKLIADARAKKASKVEIGTGSVPAISEATAVQQSGPCVPIKVTDEYPTELGGYKLNRVLGEGGMGRVYLAEDTRLGRQVAIKVMRPDVAANPELRQRFLHEARSTAALEHDHVITVFAVGEERQIPYLVMPFLKGEPLDAVLKREGKLTIKEAIRVAREAAEGLASAHRKGLIHRDIKPANVWLEGDRRRVKILDFGLAKTTQATGADGLTQTGIVMGTPAYMSPEQARGKEIDFRTDLYSLGCVLYQMVTGRRPFTGSDTMAILTSLAVDRPDSPIELNPLCPPGLSRLTEQLLAKKPDERPASAQILADALAKLEHEWDVPTDAVAPSADPWTGIDDETDLVPSAAQSRRFDPAKSRTSVAPADHAATERRWESRVGIDRKWLLGGLGLFLPLLLGFIVIRITNKDGSVTEIKVPDDSKIEIAVESKGTGKESTKTGESKKPQLTPTTFKNSVGMEFVLVGKGTGWLGGGSGRQGTKKVTFEKDFFLGKYEVTQAEWEAVTGSNPSHFSRNGPGKDSVKQIKDEDLKRFPVERVSWEDVQRFLEQLNTKEKDTGRVYRLPKTDEWEYAARGGPLMDKASSAFDFYFEKPTNLLLPEQANFKPGEGKGLKRTCRVGSYPPNCLGLYDLHGNVWEWCDNSVTSDDPRHLFRGGSWSDVMGDCRTANLYWGNPTMRRDIDGFRVLLEVDSTRLFMHDPAFAQWAKDVQVMPPEKQVEAVAAELKRLNTDFDGSLAPTTENGAITGLKFTSDRITDISPVRALTRLTKLEISGSPRGKGTLANLSPLKGMSLSALALDGNRVSDLTPLQGMPLTSLSLNLNPVSDLTPLKEMPLNTLRINETGVRNLNALKGLPLTWLYCEQTEISDLSPLAGMKLTELGLYITPVSELSALKDMPLVYLNVSHTKVSDLSPLKGMPLQNLVLNNSAATDLSPLKDLSLRNLQCDFKPERDTEVLRSIKTLESINDKPAAEFWKEVEKQQKK